MKINLDSVRVKYSSGINFDDMVKLKALPPFSDEVCCFLDDLAKEIMGDKQLRQYSDIITFGFFCRKGNINKLKKRYEDIKGCAVGRGLSFHIAPSNVPINFAYSLVVGLLSGNSCIVRVSYNKEYIQTEIICRLIKKVFEKNHSFLKDYICILSYDKNKLINDYFSSICDARIIWGGDNTIRNIKESKISSRAVDIAFADRYSIAIFSAKKVLSCNEMDKFLKDFYNDTYLYDQNACSSPRLIVWLGDSAEVEKAKEKFWSSLHNFIKGKYEVEAITAVDKLLTGYRCAIILKDVSIEKTEDNLISRININNLDTTITNFTCAGGCFLEYSHNSFEKLQSIITTKYQTISYYGIEADKIRNWIIDRGLRGIDRVVPVGKTSDFDLIWDGYDLVRALTRMCSIIN